MWKRILIEAKDFFTGNWFGRAGRYARRVARVSGPLTAGVGLVLFPLAGPAAWSSATARPVAAILTEARDAALHPDRLPSAAALASACGEDAVCAGLAIARAHGGGARVDEVASPDSDSIRRQRHLPSLAVEGRVIRLDRFGRRVVAELESAIASLGEAPIVLDLRRNAGGRLERMVRVAARFTGPVTRAFRTAGSRGAAWRDLPSGGRPPAPSPTVLIGPETASSAEILAALLRRWAGATLVGARTRGKHVVLRSITLDQFRRLLLPSQRVEVPGEPLSGGLVPDRAGPGERVGSTHLEPP